MTRVIRVVGMDPSLRNWGLAIGELDLDTRAITIRHLDVIQAAQLAGKQVRQNSRDIHVAAQLFDIALGICREARAVFVEVPIGSQSARAMASYGICVGVLGSLRASGVASFEVTPDEVKLASVGKKGASKAEIIAWANGLYPDVNWPTYKRNGEELLSAASAEHMADAIAAIHAGIKGAEFQRFLPLLPV